MIVGTAAAIAGLIIVIGYGLTAIAVAPNFRAERTLTRVGGVFFFMLCAGTHLELSVHYLAGEPITMGELESVHMLLIHAPQALAVLMFISGLYIEGRIRTTTMSFDSVIWWFAELAWLNRMSDFLDRRLGWYAGGYGLVALGSSILGI